MSLYAFESYLKYKLYVKLTDNTIVEIRKKFSNL